MSRKKALVLYLFGTLGQIWLICVMVFILRASGMNVNYTSFIGMIAIVSTVITFCLWGIWHFSYFYIEGTLAQVQVLYFLIGLLTNCFILSALYIKTNSLWICVMTHSLINVLSQLAIGGNYYIAYVSKIIIIVIAIVLSIDKNNNDKEMVSVY
jgi:hypothetical protein